MNSTLGSSVRQANDSIFESHQACQSFSLFDRNVDRISCSSFGWKSVGFVLNSKSFNYFDDARIYIKRNVTCFVGDVEFERVVGAFKKVKHVFGDASSLTSLVEILGYILEETGFG